VETYSKCGGRQKDHSQQGDALHRRAISQSLICDLPHRLTVAPCFIRDVLLHQIIQLQLFSHLVCCSSPYLLSTHHFQLHSHSIEHLLALLQLQFRSVLHFRRVLQLQHPRMQFLVRSRAVQDILANI
jgi:hypothetical protein